MELLVVADDLTGALDSTAPFLPAPVVVVPSAGGADGHGRSVEQRLERAADRAAVVGADTASREVDEQAAADQVGRVVRWARARQRPPLLLKKVDSALRGNPRAELDAMLAGTGGPVVLCPALPEQGRVTLGGVQRETRPARPDGVDVDLRTVAPRGYRPVPVDATRLRGAELRGALEGLRSGDVALVDAASRADLDAVAGCLPEARDVLVAASSGLVKALAARRSAGRPHRGVRPHPQLFVTASRHQAVRAQLARLLAERPDVVLVELDLDAVLSGWTPDHVAAAAHRVGLAVQAGRTCVLTVPVVASEPTAALSVKRWASRSISAALAQVTTVSSSAAPRRPELLVLGGDLGAAVCAQLDVDLLLLTGESLSGTVRCSAVPVLGGAGLPVMAFRSGGFGDDNALLDLVGAHAPVTQGGPLA